MTKSAPSDATDVVPVHTIAIPRLDRDDRGQGSATRCPSESGVGYGAARARTEHWGVWP